MFRPEAVRVKGHCCADDPTRDNELRFRPAGRRLPPVPAALVSIDQSMNGAGRFSLRIRDGLRSPPRSGPKRSGKTPEP